MDRAEIISNALKLLYSEFVNNNKLYVTYYHITDDGDITITAGRTVNFDMIPRSDWDKYIAECTGPQMTLTTFDDFDGTCEISYKANNKSKAYAVHWDNYKDMVKECVETVGVELYDQLLVVLSINSYCIDKLMREGGDLNG